MQLTPRQLAQLQVELGRLWPQPRRCAVCGEGQWSLSDRIFELREYHGGGLAVGGVPIIPVVSAVCMHCGNTLFFNAIILGVLAQGPEVPR